MELIGEIVMDMGRVKEYVQSKSKSSWQPVPIFFNQVHNYTLFYKLRNSQKISDELFFFDYSKIVLDIRVLQHTFGFATTHLYISTARINGHW